MDQEKLNRFYKEVEDIQFLNKSELAGNLSDHFQLRIADNYHIIWKTDLGTKIRNLVIVAANTYLV